MAKDTSMRAFKCPSCGAPLEPEVGTLTMKCPYCGGTVVIPESLRTRPPSAGPTLNEAFQFGLNGVDLNQIVGNAMQLPDAINLAQQGRLDEAADIYSKITGMEHDDALKAVQAMAGGHAVALTPGRPGASFQEFSSSYSTTPSVQVSSPTTFSGGPHTFPAKKRSGLSCFIIFAILGCFGVVTALAFGAFLIPNPLASFSFANTTLAFGEKGIGQGMLQDTRLIGVDGNGNIVAADYQDGRVQTFDSNGKFVSMFSISPKVIISAMAVGRDGKIYMARGQKIFIYDSAGQQISEISDSKHGYSDVTLSADGTLYAIANDETIVRFKSDGTIDLEIPDTFTNATGNTDIDTHLAVDGLGNMYILGSFNYAVLKYSPQGKFINRFGSENKGSNSDPAKFESPMAIAVDGYGRVFVGDFSGVLAFDSNGAYIATANIDQGVPYSLVFDGQNKLYTVTSQDKVYRLEIQKPKNN